MINDSKQHHSTKFMADVGKHTGKSLEKDTKKKHECFKADPDIPIFPQNMISYSLANVA